MSAPLECEGAPRDLGRDQGSGARAAVRAGVGRGGPIARWRDRLGLGDAAVRRFRRDLRRYFPHQEEWLQGVARGAGIPDRTLLRAAIAQLADERDAWLVGAETGSGAALWRSGAPGAVLRRVRPEGRVVSIELASPLLACPWIGLNEAGLAVAVTGGSPSGGCRVPAALLARDCLERFETVDSALAWCLGRPAAPGASILLTDARGEVAGVELRAADRRVHRPEGGVLALGDPRSAEVRKLPSGGVGDAADLERALARLLGSRAVAAAARAEPVSRRLRAARDAAPEGP